MDVSTGNSYSIIPRQRSHIAFISYIHATITDETNLIRDLVFIETHPAQVLPLGSYTVQVRLDLECLLLTLSIKPQEVVADPGDEDHVTWRSIR